MMTVTIEEEINVCFEFDYKKAINDAIEAATEYVDCPYETEVNVLLVDNAIIHEINKEHRGIDRPTDVLSFPMIAYDNPGDFSILDEENGEYFNFDTGELLIGDIVISVDKVKEQAEEYGHSLLRELSFLTVHSMLHLFGYDHIDDDDKKMENMQEDILNKMNILR